MATSILAAITYAQQLTQTDQNGIPSVLGLAFANDAQNDFIRELSARNINAAGITFPTSSVLLANTTSYAWPTTMYHLKTLSINYTDNTQINYVPAQPVEISNLQNISLDQLRLNQSTGSPLYANYGATWEVFPTPLFSANVRFVYFTIPTEYPDVGTAISYPITLDYRVLGAKIAELYKISQGDFNASKAFSDEYDKRVNKIMTLLAPASQQPIQADRLHITGFQF